MSIMEAYAWDIEPSAPSSANWTLGIAHGDPEAFSAFYEHWFDRVLAMAKSFCRRDESFCLDIVHDAMLRVVKGMKPMKDEAAVAAWMTRTVYTATVDSLRSERRRRRRETRVAQGRDEAFEADPLAALMSAEEHDWIADRLDELPVGDRELLLARFEGGLSLEELGKAFGQTGNAAHGRIRRLVQRLKQAAEDWIHGT